MTESWVYIDGKKHRAPLMPYEAEEFGWHKGTEYNSPIYWHNTQRDAIREWCETTFDPHVYKVFLKSVWFLYEHDAMLCRLKWA